MWQAAGRSRKYAILSDYLTSVTAGKRIAFGIGSAYNLDHNRPEETFSGEMETQTTHEVWSKVDKIVCRDRLAHLIFLNMFGPEKVDILPCPSFYSAQIFKVLPDAVEERLLVFCNVSPETQWGIQPEDVRIAMELQDKLVASNIPTLTMTDGDQESFQRRYGKMPSHNLRSPRAIIAAIAGYHSLISARVHACMPALSLGMEVDIIPLDSRALTAIHLGANAVAIDMKVMGRYKQSIEPIRLDQMLARTSALVSD